MSRSTAPNNGTARTAERFVSGGRMGRMAGRTEARMPEGDRVPSVVAHPADRPTK